MGKPIYDQVQIIETAECRHCFQLIDARADRCSFCSTSQKTPTLFSRISRNLLYALCLGSVIIALAAMGYALVVRENARQSVDRAVAMRDVAVADALRFEAALASATGRDTAGGNRLSHAELAAEGERVRLVLADLMSTLVPGVEGLSGVCGAEPADANCLALVRQVGSDLQPFTYLHLQAIENGAQDMTCDAGRELLTALRDVRAQNAVNLFNSLYEITRTCRRPLVGPVSESVDSG